MQPDVRGTLSVEAFAEWILRFLDEHTVTALFFFLLLKESDIPT